MSGVKREMAEQTISLPRPMVNVYNVTKLGFAQHVLFHRTYHAMTVVLGVGVNDTVGCRVVTCSVHGIGAGLVEGGLCAVSILSGAFMI